MKFEVLTLFPAMVRAYASESILARAQQSALIDVRATDIRDYAAGKHKVCDDSPYGGGAGMVMKPEPVVAAIEDARSRLPAVKVYLMSPRGPVLTQARVRELAALPALILVCGRYEGVDERVLAFVDAEICAGEYVR